MSWSTIIEAEKSLQRKRKGNGGGINTRQKLRSKGTHTAPAFPCVTVFIA